MTPQELSPFNYVLYRGTITQVLSIMSPRPQRRPDLNNKWTVEILAPDTITVAIDEVEPAPITEDFLNKSRATHNGTTAGNNPNFYYYANKRFCLWYNIKNNQTKLVKYTPDFDDIEIEALFKIEFVHHLQNFYQSNSREHLNIITP